ncbi:MAG: NADH-quinone oxidoreductase subunit N [Candidatus Eisenbacteria bacterium]
MTAAVLLVAHPYRELRGPRYAEFVTLVLTTALGMILLASASNLIMIYLALEMVSLPSYLLAGFLRRDRMASEAALKYAVYGAAASGAMLYGFSFLYGMTGSIDLSVIRETLLTLELSKVHLLVPVVFVVAGFGYKIAAVPFHMWAPDVYEGSATPVTAFFSVAPKAAGLAVLIRFFQSALSERVGSGFVSVGPMDWPFLLGILSAVTMTLGNLAAIWQDNLKRLFAYSSIAHAGYMLMGAVVMNESGNQAILFYLAVYAIMNLGAFLVVIALSVDGRRETFADIRGLGWKAPFLGAAMVVFLLSLTGIPPTAGFVGKLYIFKAVIEKQIYWLAIVGALNSVVSLYYYARIMKTMFIDTPDESDPRPLPNFSLLHLLIIALLVIPTTLFGFRFGILDALTAASRALFTG